MSEKKTAATFRLSELALRLLAALSERGGTTKTAVLESLIRKAARQEKIDRCQDRQ